MEPVSLVRQALGASWQDLPAALQAHYQGADNCDVGTLDIDYPAALRPFYALLNRLGALLDRRGAGVPIRVEKVIRGADQYWRRTVSFADGRTVRFDSRWVSDGEDRVIEWVNRFFGLRMRVWLEGRTLRYESLDYVFALGAWRCFLPEWAMLGKALIAENALDEQTFAMDFRLCHPLFGEIYRYAGRFTTCPSRTG